MRVILRTKLFWVVLIAILAFAYLIASFAWAHSKAGQLIHPPYLKDAGLSQRQKQLLLVFEDPSFYQHRGLDISPGQGVTTLTSSLARTIFLNGPDVKGGASFLQQLNRAVFKCCKKVDLGRDVMALALDLHLSKEQQINYVAHAAYFGHDAGQAVIGFSEASRHYIGKPLAQLSDLEYVGLVAMLVAPNYFHSDKQPDVHADG